MTFGARGIGQPRRRRVDRDVFLEHAWQLGAERIGQGEYASHFRGELALRQRGQEAEGR